MNAHVCHARGCDAVVPPRMFMCKRHWFMVPKRHRDALWAAYVPGQERRKDPTAEYLDVAMDCVRIVAEKEGLLLGRGADTPATKEDANE